MLVINSALRNNNNNNNVKDGRGVLDRHFTILFITSQDKQNPAHSQMSGIKWTSKLFVAAVALVVNLNEPHGSFITSEINVSLLQESNHSAQSISRANQIPLSRR